MAAAAPAGLAPAATYLPAHDPGWRYRKGTSEASVPVSAWRRADFIEDDTWLTGQTSIGFGDIDEHLGIVSRLAPFSFGLSPGQPT